MTHENTRPTAPAIYDADARTLTQALGGRWHGGYGCAPCPVCQPDQRRDQNALSISQGHDGRLLLHCFKGCDFRDILASAGVTPGTYAPPDPAIIALRCAEEREQAAKRARQAQRCWQEALPIGDTIAARYHLRSARHIAVSSFLLARADCPALACDGGGGARRRRCGGASHLHASGWQWQGTA